MAFSALRNILTRPLTAWHAVGAGIVSATVGLLMSCVVLFQWPSAQIPFGALLFPIGLLSGLGSFAVSIVVLLRSRDSRFIAAALLSAAGTVMMVGSLLLAAYRMEHSTANYPAGGNAGTALQFAVESHWPGVPQPACSAA